ncbi:site-2 protease family protein [Bradyrhizobium huanghuaihaiense]|uniref:site-2 protease family protein n=1 Tax=Bradyrhizobium huanghuaihaiense TaxID=990078 RepID=UPI0021A9D422|nr:site-2 protease family protein [Bradyrhizobium sp. CB3035]UWU79806.1 site-2 protease family protein [Bradyrhizobium sp. CB3035]
MKTLFLLLFSGLKWGKLATSGGTMLLSLAVYATIWGWHYAAGFIALLFAHEMGHYLAARQRGLDVGAPAFIPFVGAWIALKDKPVDVETEAYVAIAGPVVGTATALAVYLWARSEDSALLLAISYAGLFLNLFNLLPISPLDGGRVTAVLSPRIWFVGVPVLVALVLYRPSPMLLIVAILAAPQLISAWRYDPHAPENVAYYGVPLQTKLEYGSAYLALAALLAVMTYDVHEMLGPMTRQG